MKIYCFNTAISPLLGVFSVTIDERDTADDVIRTIWEEFRVVLQEQWPKVARSRLDLLRLTEPLLTEPAATLPDRMARYDNEKKEALGLEDVVSELPAISQRRFLTLELRVCPGCRDPAKDAMVVQRNHLSTVEAVRRSPPPSQLASSFSVLVSIAGPFIRFYGAVLADAFIVQPFTDYIFLGGDPDAEDRIERVAQILAQVRTAPYFATPELRSRFRPCPPVHARSAHRLLAEHDPPLAPRLYACAPLVGGAIMVVMAIAPGGETAWQRYGLGPLPDSVVRDIEDALKLLEQEGLVHGDVRRPNVVTVQRADGTTGGMLIDFDWSGRHGEVYYPSLLNPDVGWQQGVGPAQPIQSGHDREMWRALQNGTA
ncbi:hypothetical protein BN946_scf184942.g7 [Trametes cinnabarina]|uniref:Protein kinase domain-containing protein n=1 Tax=Pycnoporus cinnabarinus TaxID=5643 RepID=A0A060S6W3_PYCCI|nr:hypothetical protein BN946_scf184942.g7 [Trametes cinnabarina]